MLCLDHHGIQTPRNLSGVTLCYNYGLQKRRRKKATVFKARGYLPNKCFTLPFVAACWVDRLGRRVALKKGSAKRGSTSRTALMARSLCNAFSQLTLGAGNPRAGVMSR